MATRIETTNNQEQHYAYDAFGRRIAAYLITGEEVEYPLAWEEQQPCWIPNYVLGDGRRYIFDGSAVISEQAFDDATRSNATSLLERVHVRGNGLEFTAIDYNNDSTLTNPDSTLPNYDTETGGYDGDSLRSPASDRAFYYLCNAFGQVMASAQVVMMNRYWSTAAIAPSVKPSTSISWTMVQVAELQTTKRKTHLRTRVTTILR